MPDPTRLPVIPMFTPSTGSGGTPASGLELLAASASGQPPVGGTTPTLGDSAGTPSSLHGAGPFNPAGTLHPKVVKRVLNLEFVEMSELQADIWPEETTGSESSNPSRNWREAADYECPYMAGVL